MGVILKLAENKYIEWSSNVDAPVSSVMTKQECWEYIQEIEKREQKISPEMSPELIELKNKVVEVAAQQRMDRIEKNGTSSLVPGDTMENTVAFNRAGIKESCLTLGEIIELYTYTPDKKGKFPFT